MGSLNAEQSGAAWLTGMPVAMPGEATTSPNAVSELAKARASNDRTLCINRAPWVLPPNDYGRTIGPTGDL